MTAATGAARVGPNIGDVSANRLGEFLRAHRQAVQVAGLGRRQLERGRDCVEYLRRRMAFSPLLKPRVVVGADGGPRGNLFTA